MSLRELADTWAQRAEAAEAVGGRLAAHACPLCPVLTSGRIPGRYLRHRVEAFSASAGMPPAPTSPRPVGLAGLASGFGTTRFLLTHRA